MQVFVRVINAELLKTVLCKIFETEDIENRDRGRLFSALVDYVVDAGD